MNVLQSFMGCIYPGSIRTESIESLDHNPICTFQVSNIDEMATEASRGEIQLTDKDIFYFRPGKFPIQWPIGCIRRYGCNESGNLFTLETGRQASTGEAVYGFQLANGRDLVNRLKEMIEKNDIEESQNTANQNRSSFRFNKNCFNSGTDKTTIQYNCLTDQQSNPGRNVPQENTSRIKAKPSEIQKTSTYTDIESISVKSPTSPKGFVHEVDMKSMPYSNINTNVTQSLNELAKDHAANRQK